MKIASTIFLSTNDALWLYGLTTKEDLTRINPGKPSRNNSTKSKHQMKWLPKPRNSKTLASSLLHLSSLSFIRPLSSITSSTYPKFENYILYNKYKKANFLGFIWLIIDAAADVWSPSFVHPTAIVHPNATLGQVGILLFYIFITFFGCFFLT